MEITLSAPLLSLRAIILSLNRHLVNDNSTRQNAAINTKEKDKTAWESQSKLHRQKNG